MTLHMDPLLLTSRMYFGVHLDLLIKKKKMDITRVEQKVCAMALFVTTKDIEMSFCDLLI